MLVTYYKVPHVVESVKRTGGGKITGKIAWQESLVLCSYNITGFLYNTLSPNPLGSWGSSAAYDTQTWYLRLDIMSYLTYHGNGICQ